MAFLLEAAVEFLSRAHHGGRLAHAYLIAGDVGSGTRELACRLVGLVNPEALGKGGLETVLKHPDVHTVEPESKSRIIKVEQMRELEKALQMRSSQGRRKVGIVFDAERMNAAASNSFLKTLEEPPGNSLLLMVTAHPEMLLDTILSRCIFVQLVAGARKELTERERGVLEGLVRYFKKPEVGLADVFGLVREFNVTLAETKAAMQGEGEAELKREEALYKQTTEGKWLEDREEHLKVLAEARYLQARSAMVDLLLQWWGDVLRQQNGGKHLDFPIHAETTAQLAQRFETTEVLRRVTALEGLRENMNRNVNEQLAIEVAFLGAFMKAA
jgi:DNA polymerase-3 subunit delta'